MITKIITHNWKGPDRSLDLSKMTAITGPNGSGKSSILEAIAFVVSKYTPLGKKPSATLKMGSGDGLEVSLADGSGNILTEKIVIRSGKVSQETILNGSKFDEKTSQIPEEFVIPVEAIHPDTFLGMSGEARAAFLFGDRGTVCTIEPGKYPWYSGEKPITLDAMMEQTTTEISTSEKELERHVAKIQGLMGQIREPGEAGSSMSIEDIQKAIAETQAKLETANKALGSHEEKSRFVKRHLEEKQKLLEQIPISKKHVAHSANAIESFKEIIETEIGNLQAIQAELDQVKSTDAEDTTEEIGRLSQMISTIKDRINKIKSHGKCPVCETSAGNLAVYLDEQEFSLSAAEGDLAVARAKLERYGTIKALADKVVAVNVVIKDAQSKIKLETQGLESYKKTLARQETALKEAESAITAANVADLTKLQAEVAGLKERISELQGFQKKATQESGLRQERLKSEESRMKLETKIQDLKARVKSMKKVRDEFLAGVMGDMTQPFSDAIQIGFPGCVGYFEINAGSRGAAVDFGVCRGPSRVSFDTLSGGERLIALAALNAVIQKAKTGKIRLGLFEMAEADTERLSRFTQVVTALGYEQVIIAGHGLKNIPMDGWTMVDMGEKSA